MNKIAILTSRQYRSPRFLAEGLKRLLENIGYRVDIYYDGIHWLRMIKSRRLCCNFYIRSLVAEKRIKSLKDYNIFIVSDTINALTDSYSLEPIKTFNKPVLLYEVFYPGGAKYWLDQLPLDAINEFDKYLVVSGIHDSKPITGPNYYEIGLSYVPLYNMNQEKNEFIALLDFPREGYERERKIQQQCLNELKIKTISLSCEYSFKKIELIYQKVNIVFVASPEAFGVPIVQLQHYGCMIAAPNRAWTKRHALLPSGSIFYDIMDPPYSKNFIFYKSKEELKQKLSDLMVSSCRSEVRERLLRMQPHFVQGRLDQVWSAIKSYV